MNHRGDLREFSNVALIGKDDGGAGYLGDELGLAGFPGSQGCGKVLK
jgi:hypothetical protein